jgi:hypothetical protein
MDLIDLSLAWHKIAVSNGDGTQAVAGHGLDYVPYKPFLILTGEFLQFSVNAINEGASF